MRGQYLVHVINLDQSDPVSELSVTPTESENSMTHKTGNWRVFSSADWDSGTAINRNNEPLTPTSPLVSSAIYIKLETFLDGV